MNVKISEHDTYTVDVLESDSAVSVVMKAVHKHTNKYKHNINIDFDKIKQDLAEKVQLAIKQWNENEAESGLSKEATLKNPLFNEDEIEKIKFELSGKNENYIDNNTKINDKNDDDIKEQMLYTFEINE